MKIALIGCVKRKNNGKFKAKDLYNSPLFDKSLKYAKQIIKVDKIYILSAKFGLINENEIIETYNETLQGKSEKVKKEWANKVFEMMKKEFDVKNDEFYFLAGKNYSEYLKKYLINVHDPMKGLKMGERLSFLNRFL